MDCPRRRIINHSKDGIIGGRRRHYYNDCHYSYTFKQRSDIKLVVTLRLALKMYLEGLGFRAIGRISTDTGVKFWKNTKNIPASVYYSDYWSSYKEFLPKVKHIQTKAETYTTEGYNSRIRDYLARFKPKGISVIARLNILYKYP